MDLRLWLLATSRLAAVGQGRQEAANDLNDSGFICRQKMLQVADMRGTPTHGD